MKVGANRNGLSADFFYIYIKPKEKGVLYP